MLRFLRHHISSSNECKTDDLTDFFSYSKIATHGFPQRASCIALDDQIGILAIGTKDGRLRLVGGEGIEWSDTIESGLPVAYLYFARGSGVLIALCDDPRTGRQSFHRCQIQNDRLCFSRFNEDAKLKTIRRITCCEMLNREDGNSALLIGTIEGDIYALWIQNLELVDFLLFNKSSLRRVKQLENNRKQINKILIHPRTSGKLFLLFNDCVVLYNTLQDECEQVFSLPSPITDICCNFHATKLFCAKADGSYTAFTVLFDDNSDSDDDRSARRPSVERHDVTFFNSTECTKITKLSFTKICDGVEVVAFTGGVPKQTYGDRYMLTAYFDDHLLFLDFESPIIDFAFLNEGHEGSALFVLCEQELVVIDIQNSQWLPFSLPHFIPLHFSPVTYTAIFSRLSKVAFEKLCKLADQTEKEHISKRYSTRKWPMKCGSSFSTQHKVKDLNPHEVTLLLTGHENGFVNIWLTNSLGLKPWISCNTALEFDLLDAGDGEEKFLPCPRGKVDPEDLTLRKAGFFDSFCDDHRLSIIRLSFDVDTGHLVVGGRAGHVLVYDDCPNEHDIEPADTLTVNMSEETAFTSLTENNTNQQKFTRTRESALPIRKSSISWNANNGFSLANNIVTQLLPITSVTAIAFLPSKSILAVGNEFGYLICSLAGKEILINNPLISSTEILHISNLDGTLSRFKSVKKSIRQSFRRKKRQGESNNELINQSVLNLIEDCRPAEREIVQRMTNPNVMGGDTPHSLVTVLEICHCRLGANSSAASDFLFAGTYGGSVLIHRLCPLVGGYASNGTSKSGMAKWDANCPLVKEIRLRHGAPIVNIECIQDLLTAQLLIFTEEQIRTFMLPSLKPSRYKYRFTAVEGSRIRKAKVILLRNSKSKRAKSTERFISIITNRGEVYILSTTNYRRNIHVPFTRSMDANGISSAVLSLEGELFYLRSGGSELQRASIAASPNYCAPSPFRNEQFPLV